MEYSIFEKINGLAGQNICLDSLAVFFAEYLGYILIFILFLFLLKNFKKYRITVIKALGTAIFARFVIVELIRFIWYRPRPFIDHNVNLILEHSPTSSFPSGHATFYFALATIVFLSFKKLYPRQRFLQGIGVFFLIAALTISIARVYAGLHWPSDILAGAIVGIFSAWFINNLSK